MKQCIQLTFPFEKFKNWQKSTYYSSEKFWFLARTWISFWIHLSYPEFDGGHENVNYFDQNSTLEEEISNFCFFDLKIDCSSVTTDLTSKRTRFSESPWNSAYSSRFRLKNSKIDKNRRTIVQRNSDFWPGHGFHFKSISPTQNLMEVTKMWIILIKTQHLRKKSAIFCFFDLKIDCSSVITDLT